MKEVSEWVARVRRINDDAIAAKKGKSAPPKVQEYFYPLLARGFTPLDLNEHIFAIQPLTPLVQRSGDAGPLVQSLLRIPDEPGITVFSHHALLDELTALICASLGGWVDSVHAFPIDVEGNSLTSFMNAASMVDPNLNKPIGDFPLAPLEKWLTQVASLSSPHDDVLGAAIRLHHGAVLLYEHDLRAAYLLLVAGIEVLSRQYGEAPNDWANWEDSGSWDQLLREIAISGEQASRIRDRLLADKHLRLKLTFRNYASATLPTAFWGRTYSTWNYPHQAPSGLFQAAQLFKQQLLSELVTEDRASLAKALGKSYDLRSGLVHRGATISFWEAAVATDTFVDGTQLLPFAILRLILLELISVELDRQARPLDMPNFKWAYQIS